MTLTDASGGSLFTSPATALGTGASFTPAVTYALSPAISASLIAAVHVSITGGTSP